MCYYIIFSLLFNFNETINNKKAEELILSSALS